MTTSYVSVRPRDPLIARDGRPFNAGDLMKSMSWFTPSVAAGSLRSLIGKRHTDGFNSNTRSLLQSIGVEGPLLRLRDSLYLPAPADFALRDDGNAGFTHFTARPAASAVCSQSGTDGASRPLATLQPVLLNPEPDDDFKPARVPEFWSLTRVAQWLGDPVGTAFRFNPHDNAFVRAPVQDSRMHAPIDRETGIAVDGRLFSTSGLDLTALPTGTGEWPVDCLRTEVSIEMRANLSDTVSPFVPSTGESVFHAFGGERRMAVWTWPDQRDDLWECPKSVKTSLNDDPPSAPLQSGVRMMLATPAVFTSGWHPDWLVPAAQGLEGCVPHTNVKVRLVGACVNRWQAISGWSFENRGPRASRRMVPAGSVYFLSVLSGEPGQLADRWLRSVCGRDGQPGEGHNGFGLATWGVWSSV